MTWGSTPVQVKPHETSQLISPYLFLQNLDGRRLWQTRTLGNEADGLYKRKGGREAAWRRRPDLGRSVANRQIFCLFSKTRPSKNSRRGIRGGLKGGVSGSERGGRQWKGALWRESFRMSTEGGQKDYAARLQSQGGEA